MGGGHVLTNLPKQVPIYHTPERLPLSYIIVRLSLLSMAFFGAKSCAGLPQTCVQSRWWCPTFYLRTREADRWSCEFNKDFQNCQGYRETVCLKRKNIYSIASASAPDLKAPAITALQEKASKWTLPNWWDFSPHILILLKICYFPYHYLNWGAFSKAILATQATKNPQSLTCSQLILSQQTKQLPE